MRAVLRLAADRQADTSPASLATLPPVKVMPAALVLFSAAVDTPTNPAVEDTLVGRELDASPLRDVKPVLHRRSCSMVRRTTRYRLPMPRRSARHCAMPGAVASLCGTKA